MNIWKGGKNAEKTVRDLDAVCLWVYTDGKGDQETNTMPSENAKKALKKYEAANTVQIKLKLNRRTDADVLQRLADVGNKQGYIKALIREDIGQTG